MAAGVARIRQTKSLFSLALIKKQKATGPDRSNNNKSAILLGQCFCTSSSSSAPSSDSKPTGNDNTNKKKKIVERLSAVIEAANERKLPPEIRGQRNTVRSETDIINVAEQRILHSMEEGQFENLSGTGKPLNLCTSSHADQLKTPCIKYFLKLDLHLSGLSLTKR